MSDSRKCTNIEKWFAVALTFGLVFLQYGCAPVGGDNRIATESRTIVGHEVVLELLTTRDAATICREMKRNWHPGMVVMLLEIVRFNQNSETGAEVLKLMEQQTGQNFQLDMNKWYQWVWNQPYNPHPEYADFKRKIYMQADPLFAEYFQKTGNATIRLDEIRWGGVKRDGIPPLQNPKMVAADQATYLADSNVVFATVINGDVRCYPKRILAQHEMFNDTVGGQPICGVY